MSFTDRQDAGRQLAEKLRAYRGQAKTIILGLPRGGVVTAAEVAKRLHLPLDILVPRKLGFPGNEELAIGAVSEDGDPILHDAMITGYNIPSDYLDRELQRQRAESQRRLKMYRGEREPLDIKGKTAVVIDDGVATGATMLAALESCRSKGADKIITAVPVIAPDTIPQLEEHCDEVIYLDAPLSFGAVGNYYTHFPQTSDEEVIELLQR